MSHEASTRVEPHPLSPASVARIARRFQMDGTPTVSYEIGLSHIGETPHGLRRCEM
jgi:hypothetical protein